ncbi:hypothetical protein ACIPVB_14125 [Microbacterium sp. NPDC090007]|uniref:hypothetical protein n=1 Tax=Microbacterium sp. NPDC090007 TaxID=3364204 RepID=UPI00381A7E6F
MFSMMKSDNIANFSSFQILPGSDETKFLYPGKPYRARFTAADKISDRGTGMGAAITKIRLRVKDDGSRQAVSFAISGLRTSRNPSVCSLVIPETQCLQLASSRRMDVKLLGPRTSSK